MEARRTTPAARLSLAASIGGFAILAVVAATPRGPLQPVLPPGAEASGPLTILAGLLGLDAASPGPLGIITALAMGLAVAGFVLVARAAWRGEVSIGWVIGLAVAFHLVVLFLPVLASRDVFSYALYGRIASVYGANPYVATPADFPTDPWFGFIGPKWSDTPAVYGPGFTGLSFVVTRLVKQMSTTLLVFRIVAVVASLATVVIVAWVARRLWPGRSAFAVAMIGLNPAVLFIAVAGGHNDVLVGLAVIAALGLIATRRALVATAVLALGMIVKAPAAVPLLMCIVVAVASVERGERTRTLLAHLAVAGGVTVLAATPFLQTDDPSLGLVELTGHTGWLAPSSTIARTAELVGLGGAAGASIRFVFSLALLTVVVGIAVRLGRRAAREGGVAPLAQGAAWGWGLLALTLLAPVALPWYLAWSLPLAWLVPRTPRLVLVALSAILSFTHLVAEPARFPQVFEVAGAAGRWILAPAVVVLLVWLLLDLGRRLARGTPLEHEQPEVPTPAG